MARIINRIASGFEYTGFQLEKLDYYATTEGLTPQQMTILLSEIDNDYIDVKTKLKLLKCIIPRDKIPEEIFIKMTWFLFKSRNGDDLKVEVLKWMTAAYPFMAVTCGKFRLLYETFLTLLPWEQLRKFLCHLIYVMTTKKSVNERRVSLISKSIMFYGNNQRLVRVLQLYYEFCPEIFDGQFAATSFEFTNESLGDYFTRMQSRVELCAMHSQFYKRFKSMRLCAMDSNDTGEDQETNRGEDEETNEFFSIETLNQFHQVLSSLEKETDVKSVLQNGAVSTYLTTNITEENKIVLQDYILSYVHQNADDSTALISILKIFRQVQFGVPFVSDVVQKLQLETWNLNSELLTTFIQYEPLCCFESIQLNLEIVYQFMQQFGIKIKCKLVNLLSNLYVSWLLMSCEKDDFLCECSTFSLDESLSDEHSGINAIKKLGCFIDEICKELISNNDHPCLLDEILHHYIKVSVTHRKLDYNMFIRFLPYEIFIQALYSYNLCNLDSLCYLILSYKQEIDEIEPNHSDLKSARKHYESYIGQLTKLLCRSCVNGRNYFLGRANLSKESKSTILKLEKTCLLYKLPSMLFLKHTFPLKHQLSKFEKDRELRKKFYRHINKEGENVVKLCCSLLEERI